jgi:hypothetical protein
LKFFSKLAKRRTKPGSESRDPVPSDADQQLNLAREEKAYGLENLATLSAQGLMKATFMELTEPRFPAKSAQIVKTLPENELDGAFGGSSGSAEPRHLPPQKR